MGKGSAWFEGCWLSLYFLSSEQASPRFHRDHYSEYRSLKTRTSGIILADLTFGMLSHKSSFEMVKNLRLSSYSLKERLIRVRWCPHLLLYFVTMPDRHPPPPHIHTHTREWQLQTPFTSPILYSLICSPLSVRRINRYAWKQHYFKFDPWMKWARWKYAKSSCRRRVFQASMSRDQIMMRLHALWRSMLQTYAAVWTWRCQSTSEMPSLRFLFGISTEASPETP